MHALIYIHLRVCMHSFTFCEQVEGQQSRSREHRVVRESAITCEPELKDSVKDVQTLVKTMILGLKTVVWCIANYHRCLLCLVPLLPTRGGLLFRLLLPSHLCNCDWGRPFLTKSHLPSYTVRVLD